MNKILLLAFFLPFLSLAQQNKIGKVSQSINTAKAISGEFESFEIFNSEIKSASENYSDAVEDGVVVAINQTKINEIEAQSTSFFVSGWRPFVGWVCGVGVGFNYVLRPLINYVLAVFYPLVEQMKSLDMSQLMPLLMGMLGFGALRTYEKLKKKARN